MELDKKKETVFSVTNIRIEGLEKGLDQPRFA
jgi:hypothetical protein